MEISEFDILVYNARRDRLQHLTKASEESFNADLARANELISDLRRDLELQSQRAIQELDARNDEINIRNTELNNIKKEFQLYKVSVAEEQRLRNERERDMLKGLAADRRVYIVFY